MDKPNSISGIFLDADKQQLVEIELPIVKHVEKVYLGKEELHSITLEYGEFCFMGDFHYGHEAFSENVLHGYLNYLKKHPHIKIGIMGDILECAALSHFISEEKVKSIDDQIEMFVSDFRPLKDRIKFMLWGNHEERIVKESETKGLLRRIAFELGLNPDKDVYIPPPQKGAFIIFKVGEKRYGAKVHHSKTSARINQDLQLIRAGSQNVVAIIGHGHTHRLTWKPRTFRTLEMINGEVQNVVRRQYLLATGCYLKYPGYAESRSMPYTEVGSPILRFHAQENNIQYYDLTGFYKEYLARGGSIWEHGNKELNFKYSSNEEKPNSGVTDDVLNHLHKLFDKGVDSRGQELTGRE